MYFITPQAWLSAIYWRQEVSIVLQTLFSSFKQVPFNSFTQCPIFIKNVYAWQATGKLIASLITLHPSV